MVAGSSFDAATAASMTMRAEWRGSSTSLLITMKSRAAILLGLLVAGLGLATSLLLAQGGQVAVRVWIAW